jgi:hypothetical protein
MSDIEPPFGSTLYPIPPEDEPEPSIEIFGSFIKKAWPQALASALMAAPYYLNITQSLAGLIFWGAGAFGLAGLIFEIFFERGKSRRHPLARWLGIISGACILLLAVWHYWPVNPPYFPTLSEIMTNAPDIGDPIGGIQVPRASYFASYDNAIIIWSFPPSNIYRLRRSNNQWDVFRDAKNDSVDDIYYHDKYVRKLLRLPASQTPPWGGVAMLWHENPKAWSWIGSRQWHCSFDSSPALRYERFSHGIVFSTLPVTPTEKFGRSYYLSPQGWRGVAVDANSVACKTFKSPPS